MTNKFRQHSFELLKALLIPFVKEWGRDTLMRAITEINDEEIVGRTNQAVNRRRLPSALQKDKNTQRPSAISMVEKVEVPDARRRLLLDIAAQFEHKAFLPTISDVRNFLAMRGEDASNLSKRPDAFRKIINVIIDLPDESLERLARSQRYSGPSQLGSLSDAIKDNRHRSRPNSVQSAYSDGAAVEMKRYGPFLPYSNSEASRTLPAEEAGVTKEGEQPYTDRDVYPKGSESKRNLNRNK